MIAAKETFGGSAYGSAGILAAIDHSDPRTTLQNILGRTSSIEDVANITAWTYIAKHT